eukprot:21233-Heterococcus_DN1.PRE.3
MSHIAQVWLCELSPVSAVNDAVGYQVGTDALYHSAAYCVNTAAAMPITTNRLKSTSTSSCATIFGLVAAHASRCNIATASTTCPTGACSEHN